MNKKELRALRRQRDVLSESAIYLDMYGYITEAERARVLSRAINNRIEENQK